MLDKNKRDDMAILDFSKAFDTVRRQRSATPVDIVFPHLPVTECGNNIDGAHLVDSVDSKVPPEHGVGPATLPIVHQ